MSRLTDLKAAASLSDLARLLRFKPSRLAYVLFKLPDTSKYKTFEIPKRTGGQRTIAAPIDALKLLQENLSELLQDCSDEIRQTSGRHDRAAHGFKREHSIITNAREHRNRRYVFNIDLENFFPSINFGRVRGYFLNNRDFALNQSVATVIAQIACHNNALPQGSPCSPVISNLIAQVLDFRLVRLAARTGCTYTRYADDLTFSTNQKTFPLQVAVSSTPHDWSPGAKLQKEIQRAGFSINASKTHMQYRDSRQLVTGLVVNRKLNVPREYRQNVRAMVNNLLNTGSFQVYTTTHTAASLVVAKQDGTSNQLQGMLGFIGSVAGKSKHHKQKGEHLSSRELTYRRFLAYRHFFAAERPVVLCEGETDNVYLTHAIHSLAAAYPALAGFDPNGKLRLKIRLYKYRKSSVSRVLGLDEGGSGSLKNFILMYKKETDQIKASGQEQPVIVIFDNDSGSSAIKGVIKQFLGKPMGATDPFVHLFKNLYVVPTPLLNGAPESKIEDYFDAPLKGTVLNGKTFDPSNDFQTANHYGKKAFAYGVVRPNADKIDFTGFHPLLGNVVAAINKHAQAFAAAAAAGKP